MNNLRQIEIAHKFCLYILQEDTGSRTELAHKLGITPNMLTRYKRVMLKNS